MTIAEINKLASFQRNEITESIIYSKLAAVEKKSYNKNILLGLSAEEQGHYQIFRRYTQRDITPNRMKIILYYVVARLFGLTFTIKLMERGEIHAQNSYRHWKDYDDLQQIAIDEELHEKRLIELIDEDGLKYMGSVVLGLNDALVEFTGALAGYTFALQNSRMVALIGSITGIAAALSMAASEYLSTRADGDGKNALKASFYTGIAYILTVSILIAPYILIQNVYIALSICLSSAILIIGVFNFYYATVKSESFRKRFLEMAIISTVIAAISFFIGYALRMFTGLE